MPRLQIYLRPEIISRADELITLRAFKGRSDLIAALIREETERRHPAQAAPAPSAPRTVYLDAATRPTTKKAIRR
jgi:metal-responsive CopG/Arc/MetJ family transcriptional regulator